MTTVKVYRGGGKFLDMSLVDLLDAVERSRTSLASPFSPDRLAVVGDLSARLLANRNIVDRPAMTYFAHWTRRAALRELAARFEAAALPGTMMAPRGTVLHIPPRNVETIFLFSWILSFLVGNSNIVRLPSEADGAVMEAVDALIERLAADGKQSELFVNYPADASANVALSRAADVRVVWGGNAKIQAFEGLALRNGGKAIWFGDRYSYAALSGPALKGASAAEIVALARKLYVDIFTFDQMGCSSPHKFYIVGSAAEHGRAVTSLIEAVRIEAGRRATGIPAAHSVRKMTEAFAIAGAEHGASVPALAGNLMAVMLPRKRLIEDRVGGGFVIVEFIADLSELVDLIRPAHQTLTHYGFDRDELTAFARRCAIPGLSRIVPVGQALNFDAVWDGYDLLRELTRTIRVI